mgnify:CR=1 FL=1
MRMESSVENYIKGWSLDYRLRIWAKSTLVVVTYD